MRPARKGPENLPSNATEPPTSSRNFNEAGPQGAGKPNRCRVGRRWLRRLQ